MAQFIAQPFSNASELDSIIFFGMGPVSLKSLEKLSSSFLIEAIITKPNTSRGKTPGKSVSSWAEKNKVPFYQPDSSAAIYELFENKGFVSKVGVVIDYGLIIPEKVINSFPKGIINSHFSLLPKLRGADPITFALLSGQSSTGVSLMKIQPGLDTGDILASQEVPIAANETNESLTKKLIATSSELLISTLPSYISGKNSTLTEQDERQATYSRKLSKSDGQLSWSKSAFTLEREIRAFKPWPGSFTMIDGERVVIDEAHAEKVDKTTDGIGKMLISQDKNLVVRCGDDTILVIERLKPAGKSLMEAKAFLAGRQLFMKTLTKITI